MNAIKEDVAAALAVSVAMWKDLERTTVLTELARIEVGRLLAVVVKNPEYRAYVSPGTQALLLDMAEHPFDALKPAVLLDFFVNTIQSSDASLHRRIGREILSEGHIDVVCLSESRTHDFETLTKETAKVLGVQWTPAIHVTAAEVYGALYVMRNSPVVKGI